MGLTVEFETPKYSVVPSQPRRDVAVAEDVSEGRRWTSSRRRDHSEA